MNIATARAGNVIGGGDWATDRLVPDVIRSLSANVTISVRNPASLRPWQHVLEPISGYLLLAQYLYNDSSNTIESLNFGPLLSSNRSVKDLVECILQHWPGLWMDCSDPNSPHEALRLHLQIDKAFHHLSWQPSWDFFTTVTRTVSWYRSVHDGASPLDCCLSDLRDYNSTNPDLFTRHP